MMSAPLKNPMKIISGDPLKNESNVEPPWAHKNNGFANDARTKPSKSLKTNKYTNEHVQDGWRADAPQT